MTFRDSQTSTSSKQKESIPHHHGQQLRVQKEPPGHVSMWPRKVDRFPIS